MKLQKGFLIIILLKCSFSLLGQTNPSEPNILLIIADDLGIDYSNGYQTNNLMPTTPNLDSLRHNGVTFENAWATPVCTPTRATILTGKYGIKNQVNNLPGDLQTIHTSLFNELAQRTSNSYEDAVFGKWHLSSPPNNDHPQDHGVDHFEGFINGAVPNYYSWTKVTNGSTSMVNEYITAHITSAAINWINSRSNAWLAILSHAAPHSPFHIPPAGTYVQSPTNTNKQKYVAAIESLDYEIGRLTDNITPSVLANTVIIYIGDNGTPNSVLQYYPAGKGKGSLYQGGVNIPLIVSGTGVTRTDQYEDALIHTSDLYSTILESAGIVLPGGIYNSLSFKDLLSSTTGSQRQHNYTEIGDSWTIRNQQYKLIINDDCSEEFYDLIADDRETNNIISSLNPTQQIIKDALEEESYNIRTNWSCTDQIQNGNENDIDCGGSCPPCTATTVNDCKEDILITSNNIVIDSFVYAENYIESNHEISSDNALFQATDFVSLTAGFEFSGGTFEVMIDNCNITGIDDNNCPNSNSTSQSNIGCCVVPSIANVYNESLNNDIRTITTNNFPNHEYCHSNGNIPSPQSYTFEVDATPSLHCTKTSILTTTYRPNYFYGVALNGVLFAPAPAAPFIFTNTNTGEYNWNWVLEPTNNQGMGAGLVGLDCASAHTGPQGYHYHGNMFQYIEEVIQSGLSTTTIPPSSPVQIGWAADGYPILYRFGPDQNGTMALLEPSYKLRYGNRPGNGVSAPCGSYNGKYTNDYRYIDGSGDLDECNGVERNITLTTAQGQETFNYFYVITSEFPQIGRCFSALPDSSFDN